MAVVTPPPDSVHRFGLRLTCWRRPQYDRVLAELPATILLVEDDADALAAMEVLLTRAGYAVVAAEDGQRALNLLEAGLRPALMVIDLALPRVSGWDLLRYLHDDPELRTLPRIVVSGAAPDRVTLVADAVVRKPVNPVRLLTLIEAMLR